VGIGLLNGDAVPDLAVLNTLNGTVSLLLGRGDGSMLPRTDLVCGGSPTSLAVGDLNGDGISDMAIARFPTGIQLLLSGSEQRTLLSTFEATIDSNEVELRWRFVEPQRWTDLRLQRVEPGAVDWTDVVFQSRIENGTTVAVDSSVPAGAAPWYRVLAADPDRAVASSGPLKPAPRTIPPPAPVTALALSLPVPNPGLGAFQLSFDLPRTAEVRVSLVDLQGRVVENLAWGTYDAGRHPIIWSRALTRSNPRPGVYFVRMLAENQTLVRRVVLL
jgi:hypothetical protein